MSKDSPEPLELPEVSSQNLTARNKHISIPKAENLSA
jgi:hypothetical protein